MGTAGVPFAPTRPYLDVVFEHRLYRGRSAAALTSADGYRESPARLLAPLGKPRFDVDGCYFLGDWNDKATVNIPPGDHQVDVYLSHDYIDETKSPNVFKWGGAEFSASKDSVHRLHVFFGRFHTTTTLFTEDGQPTVRRTSRFVF